MTVSRLLRIVLYSLIPTLPPALGDSECLAMLKQKLFRFAEKLPVAVENRVDISRE